MRTERMLRPRLRLIGGVCAGFAEHTGLPVNAVRTAALLLTVCGGAGALLYAWLWVTVPSAPAESGRFATPLPKASLARPARAAGASDGQFRSGPGAGWAGKAAGAGSEATAPKLGNAILEGASAGTAVGANPRAAPITEILLGVALLTAGITLVASRLGANIPLAVVVPGIVVLAGAALAWRQFADIRSGEAQQASARLVRALGALVLVVVGILLFFVTGSAPNVWTVVAASIAVLLGVAVVIAPWLLRLARDLADERAARERESERAEIAAHLHDSVLQTLALIQQKAGPHSDAARLARAQERELREWLFADTPTGVSDTVDLATEVRRVSSLIEADFAVHFELVAVGPSVADAPEALVAAAREAMLNAARHAGGSVSIYLESRPSGIELSVSDRGPGFLIDEIPADRHGVRESILARMTRAGGNALLRPGPGGVGTEVVLTLPAATIAAPGTAAPGTPAEHTIETRTT
ncbi:ATP-binding protein [Cryobacterium melibiosiphilum]|uniref:ATP-binding protein n=1 Tax=Cryobacterium melibiosiphilum TaxID=995039 RepID=A0A3A5MK19_9MICO|nr:ATP-binding protein [Cryobacterium melibiosiphilum]RJT85199.1 ATP-binding protein [Cryobacterium melibiosiphilum]